jgi:hypothetical protein
MKPTFIALLLVGIFIAGYGFGYYKRGHIYKKSYEVEMAIDNLPEELAISVISGSKIGRKYSQVELGKLTTFHHTNQPGK